MKVGFTGTRQGMTSAQKEKVESLLDNFEVSEVHHGDCIGADAQFHIIASERQLNIIGHPALGVEGARAFSSGFSNILNPKPPLDRNRDIIAVSNILIATPKESREQRRSGTWATIRYAQAAGKTIYLISPNGDMQILPQGGRYN